MRLMGFRAQFAKFRISEAAMLAAVSYTDRDLRSNSFKLLAPQGSAQLTLEVIEWKIIDPHFVKQSSTL